MSRAGCGLCSEMLEQLAALAGEVRLPPVTVLDVDDDPQWVARYGLKVPVLLWDGSAVCHYALDTAEVRRLAARWPGN
jgi:hypothetical protein